MTEMRNLRSTDFNKAARGSNPSRSLSFPSYGAALREVSQGDSHTRAKGGEDRSYSEAKAKAYRMLSHRDRTSHEIAMKLKEKGFSEEIVSTVVAKLKEVGALNDKRFAEHWMRYQVENRHLGPLRLKMTLLEKGFSAPEVARLLERLSEEWDPVYVARRALLKRYKELTRLQDLRLRRKAFAFLQRKGFSTENIQMAFRNSDVIGRGR